MIDNLGNEEIGHLPSAIIINQQAFFSSHPETAESSMLLPLQRRGGRRPGWSGLKPTRLTRFFCSALEPVSRNDADKKGLPRFADKPEGAGYGLGGRGVHQDEL